MGCGASSAVHPDGIKVGSRLAILNGDGEGARVGEVVKCKVQQANGEHVVVVRIDNTAKKAPRVELKAPRVVRAVDRSKVDKAVFLLDPTEHDPGTALLIVDSNGSLRDVTVLNRLGGSRHKLKIEEHEDSKTRSKTVFLNLNPFNSVTRRCSASVFEAVRSKYCHDMMMESAVVEDAITGNRLSISKQTILIKCDATKDGGIDRGGWRDVKNIQDLMKMQASSSPATRVHGTLASTPLLIRAGPGTGKTWSVQQLFYLLTERLQTSESLKLQLVPLSISVQRLARGLRNDEKSEELRLPGSTADGGTSSEAGSPIKHNLVLSYIRNNFDGKVRAMLETAYELRSMIVLLDGVDEASGLRNEIAGLIFDELIPMGCRLVVTSRPAGVDDRIDEYRAKFVVMDLLPLNAEQQDAVIRHQLEGNKFFEHLHAFSTIRKGHDEKFEKLFARPSERAQLEGFEVEDRFKQSNGEFDPSMRQMFGARIVAALRVAEPVSDFLRKLDQELTELDAFAKIQEALLTGGEVDWPTGESATLAEKVATKLWRLHQKNMDARTDTEEASAVLSGRKESLRRRKQSASEETSKKLWERIVRQTDEVYQVAEPLKPVFDEAVEIMRATLGSACELKLGPMKDPVRVHEKANDDYFERFHDGGLAEACVVDVLRARLVCANGSEILKFLGWFKGGQGVWKMTLKNGTTVQFELIRAKNKFAPTSIDPTHFRNLLCNFRMVLVGRSESVFAEVQVHHRTILEYNKGENAHKHYEFFRARLKDKYEDMLGDQLDYMLERRMALFAEMCKVPVQLSMLCLALKAADEDGDETIGAVGLPANHRELYETAITSVVRHRCVEKKEEREAVLGMLQAVAVANHVDADGRREFDSDHIRECLGGDLGLWSRLEAEPEGVPLIKTIVASKEDRGVYQFKHLSFQEALCVTAATSNGGQAVLNRLLPARGLEAQLNAVTFQNVYAIGGADLGRAFANTLPELSIDTGALTEQGLVALTHLLPGATRSGTLRVLDLGSKGTGTPSASLFQRTLELLTTELKGNTTLEELDLNDTTIGDDGCGMLAGLVTKNTTLQTLDLRGNAIGVEGAKKIGEALRRNTTLKELRLLNSKKVLPAFALVNGTIEQLDLSKSELVNAGALLLAGFLSINASLRSLDLRGNAIGPMGLQALHSALESNSALRELQMSTDFDDNVIPVDKLCINTIDRLDLANNKRLEDSDVALLAGLLGGNTSLEVLDLRGNEISPESVTALGEALRTNTTLRELKMWSGARNLVPLYRRVRDASGSNNTSNDHLGLSNATLGDDGAALVAALLNGGSFVRTLDLSGNKIGPEGAKALRISLGNNTALQELVLKDNVIGDNGCAVFAALVAKNATLRALDLSGNEIGPKGAKALHASLGNNSALQELDLMNNPIGEAETQTLRNARKYASWLRADMPRTLNGHTETVCCIAISGDGRWLASGRPVSKK